MFSPLPDVHAQLFFFMATVGGWLLLGEGEEVAWCAATVCSVPSVWAEGIPLDGVRGLNWNGVTTHAHFQSFLPFRIFVQSSCNPVSLSCHRRRPTGGLLSRTMSGAAHGALVPAAQHKCRTCTSPRQPHRHLSYTPIYHRTNKTPVSKIGI